MSYTENVDLAAVALQRGEDANWELARLTFENTRSQGGGLSPQPGKVTMAEWCEDIRRTSGRGFSDWSGRIYKAVWQQCSLGVPQEKRMSWTEAYRHVTKAEIARSADEPVMEYKSALPPTLAPETKRAMFATLARDPVVIEEAAEVGTPTSRAVSELEHRAEIIRDQRRDQMIQSDPIGRRLDQGQAVDDLMGLCDKYARDSERFAEQLSELLRRSGRPSEDRLFWIRQAAERLRMVLDRLAAYADNGRTDLDSFLDGVLTGGANE